MTVSITNIIQCQVMAVCGQRVFSTYQERWQFQVYGGQKSDQDAQLGETSHKHHNLWREVSEIQTSLHETDVGAAAEIYQHGEPTTATSLHSNSLMIQHEHSRMSVQRLPCISSFQNASSHQQFSMEFCFFLSLQWLVFKRFLCQNTEITTCLFRLITIPL